MCGRPGSRGTVLAADEEQRISQSVVGVEAFGSGDWTVKVPDGLAAALEVMK